MKLNKTLAFAALMAGGLFAASTLQAQDSTNTPPAGEHHGMHGRPNIDQIAKDLGLTDDQKTQVKALSDDTQAKLKALHEDTSLSAADRKTQVNALRETYTAKMKAILTPEQFAKWHKHAPHHPPSGGGNAPSTSTQN